MNILKILLLLLIFISCGAQDDSKNETVDGVLVGEYRIFVTSENYTGNLGGISGANEKCQSLATAAGLERNYKAILSTGQSNASDNLIISGRVFVVTGKDQKELVASSGADLWNSDTQALEAAIDYNEKFEVSASTPWTGSTSTGEANTDNCNGWVSEDAVNTGDAGDSSALNTSWIDKEFFACNQQNPLFCISQ